MLNAAALNLGNYYHVLLMLAPRGHVLRPSQAHVRCLSGTGRVPLPQGSHWFDQAKEKSGSLKHLLTIKLTKRPGSVSEAIYLGVRENTSSKPHKLYTGKKIPPFSGPITITRSSCDNSTSAR